METVFNWSCRDGIKGCEGSLGEKQQEKVVDGKLGEDQLRGILRVGGRGNIGVMGVEERSLGKG